MNPVDASNPVYLKRRRVNAVMMSVSTMALAFGLFWLLWIVAVLLYEGASALRPSLFTQMTPPPGGDGGLANAIFGSVLMAGAGTLIGKLRDAFDRRADARAAARSGQALRHGRASRGAGLPRSPLRGACARPAPGA